MSSLRNDALWCNIIDKIQCNTVSWHFIGEGQESQWGVRQLSYCVKCQNMNAGCTKQTNAKTSCDRAYPRPKMSLFSKYWPWHGLHIQYLLVTFLRTAITGVFCSVTCFIAEIDTPIYGQELSTPIFANATFPLRSPAWAHYELRLNNFLFIQNKVLHTIYMDQYWEYLFWIIVIKSAVSEISHNFLFHFGWTTRWATNY